MIQYAPAELFEFKFSRSKCEIPYFNSHLLFALLSFFKTILILTELQT